MSESQPTASSRVCESLIDDYIAGSLDIGDFEEGLTSIFDAMPGGHVEAQNYLQSLYTSSRIDSDGFTQISEVISRVNIQSTLRNNHATDLDYFGEDQTIHLTELSEIDGDDDAGDKTVIVSVDKSTPTTDDSEPSTGSRDYDTSLEPKIVEKPHTSSRYENLGPGVTLKDRFVLLEKLGQGGMGVVFKAKDLLKVEAQDKHPYVAIKVLTDAFKKYSGSFIALQREASKAQRLAHPNIATVYDFDRDGNTVFMTMEFLQGKPLNQLIKELAKKPLKLEQALHIIEELCSGLAYAHEKLLIHSDFKPGNCFLLNDGSVKLLDFGIARASTQTDEERENTMFDPAKLSAVTPAYATPEMFATSPEARLDPRVRMTRGGVGSSVVSRSMVSDRVLALPRASIARTVTLARPSATSPTKKRTVSDSQSPTTRPVLLLAQRNRTGPRASGLAVT